MMRNNDFEALVQAKQALRSGMFITPDASVTRAQPPLDSDRSGDGVLQAQQSGGGERSSRTGDDSGPMLSDAEVAKVGVEAAPLAADAAAAGKNSAA